MLISLLVLAIIPWAYAEFFYPPMKGRGVLRTGERQTIKYKTPYTEYTIALWQQALSGGAATLGPIIYRKFGFVVISLRALWVGFNNCKTDLESVS